MKKQDRRKIINELSELMDIKSTSLSGNGFADFMTRQYGEDALSEDRKYCPADANFIFQIGVSVGRYLES